MGKRSREKMSGLTEEQRIERSEELRKKKAEEQAKLDIAVIEERKKKAKTWVTSPEVEFV